MKGRRDHQAAAIDAQEEAGIGRIHKKPIGAYLNRKHRSDSLDLIFGRRPQSPTD